MEVLAREAEPTDLPRVQELWAEASHALAGRRGADLFLAGELGSRSGTPAFRTVAEIEGMTVGFAEVERLDLETGGWIGRIAALYVEPAAREIGAGECLMELIESWARRNGAQGLDALALPGERETKNFFEGSGFSGRLIVMHRRFDRIG